LAAFDYRSGHPEALNRHVRAFRHQPYKKETMNRNVDELKQKFQDTQELLEAMLMELRFRGLEDDHRLIRQARDLCDWYQQYRV
jgi:hypothetical protein